MQKFLFIFALFFSHFFNVNAQKDKLDQLFEKYQESDGVTSIKIAKPMFSMLSKLNIDDSELSQIKPLLNKIKGLRILIVEKPTFPKELAAENVIPLANYEKLNKDILNAVKNLNYEELMTVNSKDNKIKFLSSDAENGILDNLLLNITTEGNSILMMLDGKISMDDVNKLANEAQNSSQKTSTNTTTNTTFSSTPKTSTTTTIIDSSSETITTSGSFRKVGSFNGIEVSSGIKVNFTQDKNQSIVVETDPGMEQYISTVVENGILKITINNQGNRNLRFKKLFVDVKGPRLKTIRTTSGASLATINQVNEDTFSINADSGSAINAELNGRKIILNVESGATIKLNIETKDFAFVGTSGSSASIVGNTENAAFQLTSAASCNAQNLVSKTVAANASSAGSVKVNAADSLSSVTSSSGSVRYNGKPKNFSASNSSGGTTKPIN